jgi:hypothetical protein
LGASVSGLLSSEWKQCHGQEERHGYYHAS